MPSNTLDLALVGNCTSAALIDREASIVWFCLPFFDSPSLFAHLLDEDKGGYFKITAEDIVEIKQSYVYHTPILKTTFVTRHGIFEVRDYMPRYVNRRGESYCPSEIQRNILVVSGKPRIRIELNPRPNYAESGSAFMFTEDYVKITTRSGKYNSFYLYSNLDHHKIVEGAPIEIEKSAFFVLSFHEKINPISPDEIHLSYEKTKSWWLDWSYRSRLPEAYRELTLRSAITLKLLTFQRTGAVIAAPTTSLPEIVGKNRNWDYRYCWTRDASMIIDLYLRIGHRSSAAHFIHFMLNRMLLKHENIAVMYGINGEKLLEEFELPHLRGYKDSRPVRIGNEAYRQVQNDLSGALIETIYTYFVANRRELYHLSEEIWTLVRSLVNHTIRTWKEPDSGIWERREIIEHYVHSKMMNWAAMDRAAKIANFLGKDDYAARCLEVAEEIRADILKNGWNEEIGAFTMHYGSKELDASNLLMLHYGFLKKDDPRMVATVRESYRRLVEKDFTLRYKAVDDFGKPENAFIVCSFWMVNALFLIGEEEKARKMFDRLVSCANSFGLFSEGVEIATGALTGNFPQGYSHLAFIQTVFLLETDYTWSADFEDKR